MKSASLEEIRKARGIEDVSALEKAYQDIQLELPLAAIRRAGGVTQKEMAKRLGKSQASISKFEGRGDFLCSTLFDYIEHLGAQIDFRIYIDGKNFELVPKRLDDRTYVSLVDRSTIPVNRDSSTNVIRIKDWSKAAQKKKVGPPSVDWKMLMPPTIDGDMSNALLHVTQDNEYKSATA